jgi:hypothetical protein
LGLLLLLGEKGRENDDDGEENDMETEGVFGGADKNKESNTFP